MLPPRSRVDQRAYDNDGVLRIPQSSSITGPSPSDSFVSYPGQSLGKSYSSAEMQSMYSAAPAEWATKNGNMQSKNEYSSHIY